MADSHSSKGKKGQVALRDGVSDFLRKVEATPDVKRSSKTGRLLFALDATMSRQPSWDKATVIQSSMFETAKDFGGLEIQLAFFRGMNEFKKTRWIRSTPVLGTIMTKISCRGGLTQIGRVLEYALSIGPKSGLNAIVFVGDAMEESADLLCDLAGKLGLMSIPVFIFQEGQDPEVRSVFNAVARLSGGAYADFDDNSPQALKELLSAVAGFASGGQAALRSLAARGNRSAQKLLEQLPSVKGASS